MAVACDVTNEADVAAMTSAVVEHFGRLHILVNTAGGTGPIETPASEYGAEDFMAVLRVNVLGTFLPASMPSPFDCCRRRSHRQRGGNLGFARLSEPHRYSASKWAVRGLTGRSRSSSAARHHVNDVCPNVTNGARMNTIVRVKAARTGRTEEAVYDDFAARRPWVDSWTRRMSPPPFASSV